MWQLWILVILGASATKADIHPQVAFRCGKPSIYLALNAPQRGGWVRDDAQGCVDRLEDVLAFCRRVYPDLAANLTGVVPSADVIAIHNWCDFRQKRCEGRSHNTHLTRPFKCLTTGFVPEALLVPDRCSFGHVFSPAERTECKTLPAWRSLAATECKAKTGSPNLHSMGVLTPCNNNKDSEQSYAGVEFVCCPEGVGKAPRSEAYVVNAPPVIGQREQQNAAQRHVVVAVHSSSEAAPPKRSGKQRKEFLAAELSLRQEEEKEEATLEREFEEAMAQLRSVREGKDGEKDFARLRSELILRFQQKFGRAISDEVAKERLLDSEHQRLLHERLQRQMDNARRALAQTATGPQPQLEPLWRALSAFLRLALTSEMRSLHHFTRLILVDPPQAARERSLLREHFLRMERAMASAVSESDHAPALQAELKRRAGKFAKSFGDLNASMRALLDASVRLGGEGNEESERSALEREGKARLAAILAPYREGEKVHMTRRKAVIFADDRDPNAIPRDIDLDVTKNGPIGPRHSAAGTEERPLALAVDPRHALSGVKNMAMQHAAAAAPAVEPNTDSEGSPYEIGSLIGGLVAGMAMLLLVLVVVLAVRHRQERPHAGYVMSVVELDPQDEVGASASGEAMRDERHLASMQINGYENPTYRFFDKQ